MKHQFFTSGKRSVIAREGSLMVLAVIVRGTPGDFILADLEFSLRRIEDRFGKEFREQGSDLLRLIQPYLEDCLLIQSPATSAN